MNKAKNQEKIQESVNFVFFNSAEKAGGIKSNRILQIVYSGQNRNLISFNYQEKCLILKKKGRFLTT